MLRLAAQGNDPFDAAFGLGSLHEWFGSTAFTISNTVFRGAEDAAILGAAGFNEQIKIIRKMLVDFLVQKASLSAVSYAPPEEFFCGDHDEYLKDQIKTSRLSTSYFSVQIPSSSRSSTPRSAFSRGKGQSYGEDPVFGVQASEAASRDQSRRFQSLRETLPSVPLAAGGAPGNSVAARGLLRRRPRPRQSRLSGGG